MLSNVPVTKKMWWESYDWNTCNGKNLLLVAYVLMLKFSWEMLFFESGDTEVFKSW